MNQEITQKFNQKESIDKDLDVDPVGDEVGWVCKVNLSDYDAKNVENSYDIHE